MKFVFFGYDFMLPSAARLIDEGHELLGVFSFECDNIFNFNKNCQTLSRQLDIPFITSAPGEAHIAGFLDEGAQAFLSAGYPYKVPPIDESKAKAINIHPTYLPHGRGLMPIPHIIMNSIEDAAGFTAHKMTQEFDAGDILNQEKFDLSTNETVETYTAKIAMRAPQFTSDLFKDLENHWDNATSQDPKQASTYPAPTGEDRTLDWSKSIDEIDAIGRAFGRFGSLAHIGGQLHAIYSYDIWKEQHGLNPGYIAAQLSREIIIAVSDGFICIKDAQPVKT